MRKETNNLCPLCGGKKIPGKTTFTIDLGFGLFVVRDVPASVCSQCGEEWIDNQTAKHLEEYIQKARGRKYQFEVIRY